MINDKLAVGSKLLDAFKIYLLLIDADDAIRRYLRIVLQAENFAIYEAKTVRTGLTWMTDCQPEIVLLDLQRPSGDGLHLITHQQIWQAVNNDSEAFKTHTLHVHLSNLRRKIEVDPNNLRHILTEIAVGYRFQTETAHSQI